MDLIDLTKELVHRFSPTGDETAVSTFTGDLLERLGFSVVRQSVGNGLGRFNVWATREPPVVVLSTHLDVVPPAIPIFEDADWLYGRGTCDAKGAAAAMIVAAERLASEGERRVGLLFTVGEETVSDGAKAAKSLSPKGRFLVNGEPTDNRLGIGQMGVFGMTLTATGVAAHSAYPEQGESAIEELCATLQRVRQLELPADLVLGSSTLNIGQISGGVAANVIAAEAKASILFRLAGSSRQLEASIRAMLPPKMAITITHDSPVVSSPAVPGWDSIVVRFGSDLPHLWEWGTGYLLGPGSIRVAHSENERISKVELKAAVDGYCRLARALLAKASDTAPAM